MLCPLTFAAGHYQNVPEATQAIIKVKTQSKPNKKSAALYDYQYSKYAALYPALKDNFATLGG